jgi:uncharacterized protein
VVDVAPADVVVVLTRAPSAGGKARLFAALRRPCDSALLTALLLDTLDGVRASGIPAVVAVRPASTVEEVRALIADDGAPRRGQSTADHSGPSLEVIAQSEGHLGTRMRDAMTHAFADGARRVVLIGSDLPSIRASVLHDALAVLDRDPDALVLGPALDGGYYLIAAGSVPAVFDGIRWDSADVMDQTRVEATRAGLRVHLVAPLGDVDTVADLQRLTPASPRSFGWARSNGIVSSRGSETADGAS